MKWTTNRNYVVFKNEKDRYYWERSEYMPTYKDFDLFTPILYTDRRSVAEKVWLNLRDHKKRQAQ